MQQLSLPFAAPGLIAGVDEAGRGPLAGPVFAAAVVLDDRQPIIGLADSKKLSEKKRQQLCLEIQAKALCFKVAQASVQEIDKLNILQASLLAMSRAVAGLRLSVSKVLVDGNQLPQLDVYAVAIVNGDALEPCISAASILAKTYRDAYCLTMAEKYPNYAFEQHKGYATALHQQKLAQYGPCPEHRCSFAPVRKLLK